MYVAPASIPQYSQQAQNSQSTVRREIGGRYVAAQNGNAPETTTASSSDGNVTRQPERTSLPQNSTLETEIPKPAIVVGPDGAATVNGIAYRQGISDSTPAAAHDETMQQAVSENQIEDEEMRDI